VFGFAAERAEVDGLDVDGVAEFGEGFRSFGVEGCFFVGEGDAAFPDGNVSMVKPKG
jgi:hypothetical protein